VRPNGIENAYTEDIDGWLQAEHVSDRPKWLMSGAENGAERVENGVSGSGAVSKELKTVGV